REGNSRVLLSMGVLLGGFWLCTPMRYTKIVKQASCQPWPRARHGAEKCRQSFGETEMSAIGARTHHDGASMLAGGRAAGSGEQGQHEVRVVVPALVREVERFFDVVQVIEHQLHGAIRIARLGRGQEGVV